MMFGQSFSSGFGDDDNMLAGMDATQRGTTIDVVLYGRPGFGDSSFGVYLNCKLYQTVFLRDGATSPVISLPARSGNVSIHALSNGWCQTLDQSNVARGLDSETSSKATIRWDWSYDVMPSMNTDGTPDAYLTNWSFTGLTPSSGNVVNFTRRSMPVQLTVTSGVATVSMDAGKTTITGTCAVGDTMTLSDGSGITGTVQVDSASVSNNSNLTFRFPQYDTIYRDNVEVGTVNFNGAQSASFTDVALPAGMYFYSIEDMLDNGVPTSPSAQFPVQVKVVPAPVTGLKYFSGNQYSTVIDWTPSTTTSVMYNVYVKKVGETFINTIEPYLTTTSPSALLTDLGFNGMAEVMVRVQSTISGLEEMNPYICEIEYDLFGEYVPPRPNVARLTSSVTVPVGNNLNPSAIIGILYPSAGEKGVATTVQLFARDMSYQTTYDYGSPVDTQTLTGAGDKTATLSYLPASGTWWAFVARACTAAGVLSPLDSQETRLCMSWNITVPSNIQVTASRG